MLKKRITEKLLRILVCLHQANSKGFDNNITSIMYPTNFMKY